MDLVADAIQRLQQVLEADPPLRYAMMAGPKQALAQCPLDYDAKRLLSQLSREELSALAVTRPTKPSTTRAPAQSQYLEGPRKTSYTQPFGTKHLEALVSTPPVNPLDTVRSITSTTWDIEVRQGQTIQFARNTGSHAAWEGKPLKPLIDFYPKTGLPLSPQEGISVRYRSPYTSAAATTFDLSPSGSAAPSFPISFRVRPELHLFTRDPSSVYALLSGQDPFMGDYTAFYDDNAKYTGPYSFPMPNTGPYPLDSWYTQLQSPNYTNDDAIFGLPFTLPADVVIPYGRPDNSYLNGAQVEISPLIAGAFWRERSSQSLPLGSIPPSYTWEEGMPWPPYNQFHPTASAAPGSLEAIWNITLPQCSSAVPIQPLLGTFASTAADAVNVFTSDGFSFHSSVLEELTITTFMRHQSGPSLNREKNPGDGLVSGLLLGGRIFAAAGSDVVILTLQSPVQQSIIDFVYAYPYALEDGFLTLRPEQVWLSLVDPSSGNANDGTLIGNALKGVVTDFLDTKVPKLVLDQARLRQATITKNTWVCNPNNDSPDYFGPASNSKQDAPNFSIAQGELLEALLLGLETAFGQGQVSTNNKVNARFNPLTDAIADPDNWACLPASPDELYSATSPMGSCLVNNGDLGRAHFLVRMRSLIGLPDEIRLVPFENFDDFPLCQRELRHFPSPLLMLNPQGMKAAIA